MGKRFTHSTPNEKTIYLADSRKPLWPKKSKEEIVALSIKILICYLK
jgi:glutamate racemase